jgi:hypothetical protein
MPSASRRSKAMLSTELNTVKLKLTENVKLQLGYVSTPFTYKVVAFTYDAWKLKQNTSTLSA